MGGKNPGKAWIGTDPGSMELADSFLGLRLFLSMAVEMPDSGLVIMICGGPREQATLGETWELRPTFSHSVLS